MIFFRKFTSYVSIILTFFLIAGAAFSINATPPAEAIQGISDQNDLSVLTDRDKGKYGPDYFSINPVLPSFEHIPDAEPRVFGGRVYVYGSHDDGYLESTSYCMEDYVTWSAPLDDLNDWRFEGYIYAHNKDPYARMILESANPGLFTNWALFAPDVIEVNGKYWMYYGVGLTRSGLAVAVSDSPTGPFEYVGRVRYPEIAKPVGWVDNVDLLDDGDMAYVHGVSGHSDAAQLYDPAMLYHEGRLYMYFAQGQMRMVELDVSDMRTVLPVKGKEGNDPALPDTYYMTSSMLAVSNGPSIRVINGKFYLAYYSATGGNGMSYAIADDPWGPFEAKGRLVTHGNIGYQGQTISTAFSGNTHGGMLEVDGVWHIFHHRQTGGGNRGRQMCVERLEMDENGLFAQAEFSARGFNAGGMDAYYRWPAYMANYITRPGRLAPGTQADSPLLRLEEHPDGDEDYSNDNKKILQVFRNLRNDAVVGYSSFDFGNEELTEAECIIEFSPEGKGTIDVILDHPDNGTVIGTINIDSDEVGWQEFKAKLKPLKGEHSVYFVFHTSDTVLGKFSFFEFTMPIKQLIPGSPFEVTVPYINNTGADVAGTGILAVYDIKGRLLLAGTTPFSAPDGGTADVTVSLVPPEGSSKAVFFLWNNNMVPLVEALRIIG